MKRFLFFLWNFWPPFLGAGISIKIISKDFHYVRAQLKRWPWTKNVVGTHFGGSIYAMTDPFYMALLIYNLGPNYIVWDKAATIRFKKPGITDLFAEFELNKEDLDGIKQKLESSPKIDWERDVLVKDTNGEVVAEIHKVIHIRKK